jgi:hypothetical protein
VGINTTSPTATLDVNGTQRIRALNNVSLDSNYYRNIVSDNNGNLGYTNRSSGKPTPPDITLSVAVNSPPTTIATGVNLSEFTPVITTFGSSADASLPAYVFYESGGNLIFDLTSPNNGTVFFIKITFIRKN